MTRSFIAFLLISVIAANPAYADSHTAQARQYLKNYALANCIADQFPENSALKADVEHAIDTYGATGKGMHKVLKDKETLALIHDPYIETKNYMLAAYKYTPAATTPPNTKIVFYACLRAYKTEKLDTFIKTQDAYIKSD